VDTGAQWKSLVSGRPEFKFYHFCLTLWLGTSSFSVSGSVFSSAMALLHGYIRLSEWVCGNVSKLKSVSCNYLTFGEEKAHCCGPQILSQTRLVLTRMYWILQVCVFSTVKYVCFVYYFENMTEVKHGAQHWDSKRHSVSTRAHLSGLQSCV
jgi:hypothetical protein